MTVEILKITQLTEKQINRDKVRTLRKARRAGWVILEVGTATDRYWNDIVKEIQTESVGKVVPWYNPPRGKPGLLGIFAFENPADATWVRIKFG